MDKPNTQMQLVLDHFAKLGAPPLETLDYENARRLPTVKNAVEEILSDHLLARAAALVKPNPPHVADIDHVLIPREGGQLLARIYRPREDKKRRDDERSAAERQLPALVYFHGGGWVIANPDVYDASCRALCAGAGCIVVSVAYRQAPEHKYPAAVDDAHAAVQWVLRHAAEIGADPARIAVGGESAGGNLATVACLRAAREGGLMPVAQLLIYPVTDSAMSSPSYREHAQAKPLNAAMMAWFWKHYLRGNGDATEIYAAPLRASEAELGKLPPAIVITAQIDPLRDEGEAYAAKLERAGVSVTARRFEGVTHEFFGLSGLVTEARNALHLACDALRERFGTEPPPISHRPFI